MAVVDGVGVHPDTAGPLPAANKPRGRLPHRRSLAPVVTLPPRGHALTALNPLTGPLGTSPASVL